MTKQELALEVIERLKKEYPDADIRDYKLTVKEIQINS